MAPQPQQSPDYYAYDRRVRAEAEASTSWASAFKLFIIVAATAAFIWLIYFAFGTTGLQFALIALFVVGVAILVWFLMLKTHQQVSDTHADAVNNIVRFQHEDDAGETLRSLVVAISNGQRAGTQLDSRLLQLAGVIGEAKDKGMIAAHQAGATIDAVRQQTVQNQQQSQEQQRAAFYRYAAEQQAIDPQQDQAPPERRSRSNGFNVYE